MCSSRDSRRTARRINMLYSDRFADIGEGTTYQSTWVDITAWQGA